MHFCGDGVFEYLFRTPLLFGKEVSDLIRPRGETFATCESLIDQGIFTRGSITEHMVTEMGK